MQEMNLFKGCCMHVWNHHNKIPCIINLSYWKLNHNVHMKSQRPWTVNANQNHVKIPPHPC
jgi:hypothetical protein